MNSRYEVLAFVLSGGGELLETVGVDALDALTDRARGSLGKGAGSLPGNVSTHGSGSRSQWKNQGKKL
jgi:hypothetical protein